MKRNHIRDLLFLLLLPLFFVMHGFYENYEFIGFSELFYLVLSYWFFVFVVFGLIFIFTKRIIKTAVITFIIFLMFFFFGWVQDLLKSYSGLRIAGRYSILLPLWIVSSVLLIIYITRSGRRMQRWAVFLNSLLAIFLIVDIAGIFLKASEVKNDTSNTRPVSGKDASENHTKPNFYFLVFDEYASSVSLKERFGFRNDLDDLLKARHFNIHSLSRSNYHSTPLSIASILNMSYIAEINDNHPVSAKDYNVAARLISNAGVFSFLKEREYEVVNYSVFDIQGNPSPSGQSYLPIRAKLISDRVLTARVSKDLGWWIYKIFPFIGRLQFKTYIEDNDHFYEKVIKSASEKKLRPEFIYAHFLIPHPPYFFDKDGNRKKDEVVFKEMYLNSPTPYLEYVQYANSRIINMVDAIQKNDSSSVIIIMGDHGYRKLEPPGAVPPYFFQNFNAVYVPGSDYSLSYDSITGVNQFRMIFNEVFNQKIPMLEDRVIHHKNR